MLFPGYFANAECRDTYRHPLHRDDELYATNSARQQVELLTRRTAEKKTKGNRTQQSAASSRPPVAADSSSSRPPVAADHCSSTTKKSKRNASGSDASSNRSTVSPNENIQLSNKMEAPTTTMHVKRSLPNAIEAAAKDSQHRSSLLKSSRFKSPRL